jgi:hypothetical protein
VYWILFLFVNCSLHDLNLNKKIYDESNKIRSLLGDTSVPISSLNIRRGDTALLVGSIMILFMVLTIGIAFLISRKQRQGNEENEYHSLMTK